MKEAVETAPETVAGLYCCWKFMLQDRWLKRCDSFPRWQFCLMRQGRARFVDFVHGQKEGSEGRDPLSADAVQSSHAEQRFRSLA